eukprot:8705026-Alexandrium_andersonii.AAC.1
MKVMYNGDERAFAASRWITDGGRLWPLPPAPALAALPVGGISDIALARGNSSGPPGCWSFWHPLLAGPDAKQNVWELK